MYLEVVPSLESRLVNTRIAQLETAAASLRRTISNETVIDPDLAETARASTGARVVLFEGVDNPPTMVETSALPLPGSAGVRAALVIFCPSEEA